MLTLLLACLFVLVTVVLATAAVTAATVLVTAFIAVVPGGQFFLPTAHRLLPLARTWQVGDLVRLFRDASVSVSSEAGFCFRFVRHSTPLTRFLVLSESDVEKVSVFLELARKPPATPSPAPFLTTACLPASSI